MIAGGWLLLAGLLAAGPKPAASGAAGMAGQAAARTPEEEEKEREVEALILRGELAASRQALSRAVSAAGGSRLSRKAA